MHPAFRLGLTGGIGSGKSTVARMLAELGATVVDADAIAHDLTAPGGLAMPAIAAAFGRELITPTGALDREKMRLLAYANSDARRRLESIIHPLVAQETLKLTVKATDQGCPCIVFDIPLLVESSTWRGKLDWVLVVDCTAEVQISRVMARSRLTRADVQKIMSSQAGREYRLSAADAVIFNVSLSLDQLRSEVRQVAHHFGLSSS